MHARVQDTIDKIQRRFLWGGPNLVRKLYLVNWASICNYRDLGRLEIIDICLKHKALLNKWLWRFGNNRRVYGGV